MAVTMKKAIFWDVMLCGSCKNRSFRGTYSLHDQGDKKPHSVTSEKMEFFKIISTVITTSNWFVCIISVCPFIYSYISTRSTYIKTSAPLEIMELFGKHYHKIFTDNENAE
jgi:hypothetical protein